MNQFEVKFEDMEKYDYRKWFSKKKVVPNWAAHQMFIRKMNYFFSEIFTDGNIWQHLVTGRLNQLKPLYKS